MTIFRHSLFWAAALLGIALLAVFDIVPEELAQYSVIALPVLATLGFISAGGRQISLAARLPLCRVCQIVWTQHEPRFVLLTRLLRPEVAKIL